MVTRLPATIRANVQVTISNMAAAMQFAHAGDMGAALLSYQVAENVCPIGSLVSPRTSMCRHIVGGADTVTIPLDFTEDEVPLISMPTRARHATEPGYLPGITSIDRDNLAKTIGCFIKEFNPGFHALNTTRGAPHVMVLSPGRSGTVSLFRLLQDSNVAPYHHYWFHIHPQSRWEMMVRFISGDFAGCEITCQEWLTARAAEWVGAESEGQVMVGINHWDTIMAPVFASLHRNCRFIYLKRNRDDVFKSLHDKNQYGMDNLRPLRYDLSNGFSWQIVTDDPREEIDWYLRFTEAFALAVGDVMGERFIKISADRLFGQDREEIAKLIEFTGAGIDLDAAVAHYGTKINEKSHKLENVNVI